MRIGVLALQGDFARHLEILSGLKVDSCEIRTPDQLEDIDGLIIPGGESTTMTRIMRAEGWQGELRKWTEHHPVFGTCAGLILMASEVDDPRVDPLGCLPIKAFRNAYGAQVWSFQDVGTVTGLPGHPEMEMIFIRAPKFEVLSDDLDVLGRCRGEAVLIRKGHHVAATFHPELAGESRVHQYWIDLVKTGSRSGLPLTSPSARRQPPSAL